MTVIAIRDGIMAVDSSVTCGGILNGEAQKWAKVEDFFGGGYVAGSGDIAICTNAVSSFAQHGAAMPDGDTFGFIHLRADGSVAVCEKGHWFEFDAPFYAEGSGSVLAFGAMAAGASAEEAAKVACQYDTSCGGEIHVLKIGE